MEIHEECVCGTVLEKRFPSSLTQAEKQMTQDERTAWKRQRSKADLICPNCGKGWISNKTHTNGVKTYLKKYGQDTTEQKKISGLYLLYCLWGYTST